MKFNAKKSYSCTARLGHWESPQFRSNNRKDSNDCSQLRLDTTRRFYYKTLTFRFVSAIRHFILVAMNPV